MVAAAGALAFAGVASGPANAAVAGDGTTNVTVTSGTGTMYMVKDYVRHMAAQDIKMAPIDPQSTAVAQTFTTTIYSATGGDADLSTFTGAVQYYGGTLVTNTVTGQQVVLNALKYDVADGYLYYTVTNYNNISIDAMYMGGTQSVTIKGDVQTYRASELLVSADMASQLDTVLSTNAFHAGDVMGSWETTFTVG